MRKKEENIRSSAQEMTREELTRTQVLNLSDFEQVTKYEKTTSKRPAIFLAILGIFCIVAGVSYNPIMNIVIEKITPPAPIISKRVLDASLTKTLNDTMTCRFVGDGTAFGVDITMDVNLSFYDGKLTSYTKTMDYVVALGKEKVGQQNVDAYYPIFKQFELLTIPGYQTTTVPLNNGFETKVLIDLKTLNPTQLTTEHNNFLITMAEFAYGDTKDLAYQKASIYGYTCENPSEK